MLGKLIAGTYCFFPQRTFATRCYATATRASAVSVVQPVYVDMTPSFCSGQDPKADGQVAVLDPTVFDHPLRRDILHLCVNHYRDSLRQGSANTKTRGEVRGSGRKIRPQKGTGRARLGDAQSPMLRGGGVAFGPKPRDFSTKLPRKVIEMGLRIALSAKVKEQNFGVMMAMSWPSGKTKNLVDRVHELGLGRTLFITGEDVPDVGLVRAMTNISKVKLVAAQETNIYEILKWNRVVLDAKAVDFFERTLSKRKVLLRLDSEPTPEVVA